MSPSLPLGVPLMDADHAALEALFAEAFAADDADLAEHFFAIEAEVIAHFAREEVLMRETHVPIIHCHETQHHLLLREVEALRPSADTDPAKLRAALANFAVLVESHVASVDRVTSQFLGGTLDPAVVSALRLPQAV